MKPTPAAKLMPILMPSAAAVFVHAVGELVLRLKSGEEIEGWLVFVMAFVFLAATVLGLFSVFLGWAFRLLAGVRVPTAGRMAWGALLGTFFVVLVDLPNIDLARWPPYALALTAGLLSAWIYDRSAGATSTASEESGLRYREGNL